MLGHDWGSVATWEYLSRPGAADRVASFTSASGPGIAHYGGYIFDSLKRPYRPVQFGRAIDRLLRLTYWYPFAAPLVAPAVFKRMMRASDNKLLTDRVPAEQRYRSDSAAVDLVNSLKIYRSLAVPPPTTFPADRYVMCRCSWSSARRIPLCGRTDSTTCRDGCRGCGVVTSTRATGRRCRIRRCWPPPSRS